MDIILNDIRTAYTASGSGPTVLLLHAWGADSSSLEPLRRGLAPYARAVSLDLPGAGESDPPPFAFGLEEYADFLEVFMAETCGPKSLIIGHGLGGRLALVLASRGKAGRLLLTGVSPGPRVYPPAAKAGGRKPGPLYLDGAFPDSRPERHYAAVGGLEKEILAKTGAPDLLPLLPKIAAETLLIWGEQDQAAPAAQAWQLQEALANSGLVLLENCGHAPFAEAPSRFLAIARYFLCHSGPGGIPA